MTTAWGQSQPVSQDLVIVLGPDLPPVETSWLSSLGVRSGATILRGDNFQAPALDTKYLHYRNAISGLNISVLETEFNHWFKELTQFLEHYAAREKGIQYQSVNLLLAGSLTIYLRLYEQYEEFFCARLLLSELRPQSILIIANSPESSSTDFTRSVTYLASFQGIPVNQVAVESRRNSSKRNLPVMAFRAVQKELGMLGISIANRLQGRTKQCNIICVEENAYNLPVYLPAFEKLTHNQSPIFPYFLSNNAMLYTALDKLPYTGISPYDGLGIKNIFVFASDLRNYLRAIDKLFQEETFHQLFTWSETNVWQLIHKGLKDLFVRKYVKLLWYLISIDRLLTRLKPKAVITTYGLAQFRNAVIELAKMRQIPTIILQNAAVPHQLLWGLLPDHSMLVWGQATKEFLGSMGANPEKLHVVGSTKYAADGSELIEIHREQEVKRLGFSPEKPLILYTANFTGAWGQYYDWETTQMLTRIVNNQAGYQLMITLHPRCPQNIVDRVARVELDRIKLLRSPDMSLLYRIADVGVTQFSTTAIDASIYGLPIISVLTHNRPDWLGMGSLGAALIARDETELAEHLKHILMDDEIRAKIHLGQQTYHTQFLNDLDEQASSRIYNHILDSIQSQDQDISIH